MRIICRICGEDIDAKGQDNMSYSNSPICEDCDGKEESDRQQIIDESYDDER